MAHGTGRWWTRAAAIGAACLIAVLPAAAGAAAPAVIDGESAYPEGPLWLEGRLYYVEYAADDVKVWDGTAIRVHWRQEHCGPSGLIGFGAGHLLVACYDSNSIVEVDERGTTLRTITADRTGKPFAGPNDFAPDGEGGVYFSASGVYDIHAPIAGAVLHLAASDMAVTELANTLHYANGLTRSADGRSLLVAEMLAARILEFPLNADGSLGPRRVWARLEDLIAPTPHADAYNGPDGLKLGPDGNYYIAQNGSGRVLVVDAHQRLLRAIRVPTPFVTNVAFGARGAEELFITGTFDQWKAPYRGVVYRWRR